MTITPILWLLAFIPALIALYFLKLRRQEKVVSSTILWRRSIEDMHVNAPLQKLRRSILLLLQLLVLCGLIFALWRPRTKEEGVGGRNLVVLLDTSASMAAKEDGAVRFEATKAKARELISAMAPGDRMALLTFSSQTQTKVPLSEDTRALLAAVDSLEVTTAPTRLIQAITNAGALAEALVASEIHVLGDGCYEDLTQLPDEMKRLRIEFFSQATPRQNIGITNFDVRQSFEVEPRTEALAFVENLGSTEWRGTIGLYSEDVLQDARELELDPGKSEAVIFDCSRVAPGIIRVEIESDDALDSDDTAWAIVREAKPVRVVVVGEDNLWLDLALRANRTIEHRRIPMATYEAAVVGVSNEDVPANLNADVVIFDRRAPPGPPQLPAIYIACLPTSDAISMGDDADTPLTAEVVEEPTIIDWDNGHPVNRFLIYTNVYLQKSMVIEPKPGVQSLVDTDEGTIIATVAYRDPGGMPTSAIVIGFDIFESNWPFGHHSFPIFFSNAVTWLRQQREGSEKSRYRSGEPVIFRPDLASQGEASEAVRSGLGAARVRTPSGALVVPGRDEYGGLVLSSTDEIGVYEVIVGGETLARIPVSLLSAKESRLVPQEEISFGEYTVEVSDKRQEERRDLWKWFAGAAVVFLLIEWYVYNRRMGL